VEVSEIGPEDSEDFTCSDVEEMKKQGNVEGLVRVLKQTRNVEVRNAAEEALLKIGEPAVEPLIRVLEHERWGVRRAAAYVLGYIGDGRAVEPLIKALKDEDEDVRYSAACALGEIGDRRAVEPLIEALSDEDEYEHVRMAAAEALALIGDRRAVEPMVRALESDGILINDFVADALVNLGLEEAVEPLIRALGSQQSYVRRCAAEALGKVRDERAVEPLVRALRDEDSWVRGAAAEALSRIGWRPRNPTERAYHLLGRQEWKELERLGEPAVEPLIRALNDDSESQRRAVETLVNIGEPAAKHLVEALRDERERVRRAAAEALERIGWRPESTAERVWYLAARKEWEKLAEGGEPAVGPLTQLLRDREVYVREKAAITLGRIGDRRATKHLEEALRDEDSRVRKAAAEALKGMRWRTRDASTRLAYLVARREWRKLVKIGEPAVEPLVRLLGEPVEEVQRGAAEALGKIGKPALGPLTRALRDENKGVRAWAAHAMGVMRNPEALEPLVQALKDREGSVREKAADALGRLGDERAIEPLIQLLLGYWERDEDHNIYEEEDYQEEEEREAQIAAICALEKIGGWKVIEALDSLLDDLDDYVYRSVEEVLTELREREATETLRRAFEASNFKLSEPEHLDYRLRVFHVKRKHSKYYMPIEIELDAEYREYSLRCELWCGLHGVGEGETVKEIADWLRKYAKQIRREARALKEMGFELVDRHIDGIHYLNFFYEKSYQPDRIDELIKDLKRVAEEVC